MKIILLRHEKRENYPGFFSNLTQEGFIDSFKLIKKFEKYKINQIYCSPLVRTLQTIHPYCLENKVKVNIEYALYEYRLNPYFLLEPKTYNMSDIKNKYLTQIRNTKYKSVVKKKYFNYLLLEDEVSLEGRVRIFFNYLKNKKNLENKTILIVSHKGVINMIKRINNIKINGDFPKGHYEIINI